MVRSRDGGRVGGGSPSGGLPDGTVTFVLTDIVGSTELWEQAPVAMRAAMVVHDRLIDAAVEAHDGVLVKPRGEGDSRFAVFRRASEAVLAATQIVSSFVSQQWDTPEPVRLRVGVHTGEADLRDGDYYGSTVNLCARLRGLAAPNQILVSEATSRLVLRSVSDIVVEEVGAYPLKGISLPERVFTLHHPDLPIPTGVPDTGPAPPGDSGVAPARRRPAGSTIGGGRSSVGARVFLNYRREDSSAYAGRLFDSLSERFGHDSVFMDIDNIAPGSDFLDVITDALKDCVVMLVVIGRSWLTTTDRDGRARIEQPDDLIRIEIEVALSSGTRVIPILVGGASMPDSDELPRSLAALARRHAIELTDLRWRSDIEDIHGAVSNARRAVTPASPPSEVVPVGSAPPASEVEPKLSRRRRWPTIAAGAVAVLLAGTLVVSFVTRKSGGSASQVATTAATTATTAPCLGSPAGWQCRRRTGTERQQVAATRLGNQIWVLGGLDASSSTKTVEIYEPLLDHWDAGPPLPIPLDHAMAVTFKFEDKEEIVVLGGFTNSTIHDLGIASDKVFRLDGNTWRSLPALLHPRGAGAAAVVGARIVVTGGQAGRELVTSTEIFDGTKWIEKASVVFPVEHTAAVSDGHYMYVIGGRQLGPDKNTDALQRYDPDKDEWKQLAKMKRPRGSLGAAIVGRSIVAVGGEETNFVFDTVEAYDIATDTWATLPSLNYRRHGLGVVAVDTAIYAFDGSCSPFHDNPCDFNERLELRP